MNRRSTSIQSEPTLQELHSAWTSALETEDIPGARADSLRALQTLRNQKATWVGKEENDLRFALDRYLRDSV